MALPTNPKKEPRPVAVSIRLTQKALDLLKSLQAKHNMSQGEIIEHLIRQEANEPAPKKTK